MKRLSPRVRFSNMLMPGAMWHVELKNQFWLKFYKDRNLKIGVCIS
ncbi:MAG: hypothetical protein WCK42_06995 [Myxococcaceae bacterium]